ncbi:MAG: hypothetical protein PHW18_05120 [Sulfuricurvum sp.]|uniref:hypothetical protein n=1 Tax=Sulfuricurvum sp. TaxID=2025608 RepID=UPI00260D7D72|nr:hypothetical protein [Sulfuricurvum sp.]MDD2828936.1 hypothetical protein [Sulfuricurvum sp.]MDD4950035.1 hypothetical protein [Sulfuricurvum sp.]
MKILFGLIIVILTVINLDLLGPVLISYWLTILLIFIAINATYFFVATNSHKPYSPERRSVLLVSKWILYAAWMFVATIIAFVLLLMSASRNSTEIGIVKIDKRLNVIMKDNVPCFYIDSSKEIDEFEIGYIVGFKYIKIKDSYFYEDTWRVTHYKLKLHIPLTSIVGKDQCIPYGLNNEIHTKEHKKLETNVLYKIAINGVRKVGGVDQIMADSYFYLSKNPKTGNSEISLASQEQINIFEKHLMLKLFPSEDNNIVKETDEYNSTIKTKDQK